MTSINRTSRTCRWIIKPCEQGSPAVYCDKPVGYSMPGDDDRNRVRSYNVFCAEHKVRAAQNAEEDMED